MHRFLTPSPSSFFSSSSSKYSQFDDFSFDSGEISGVDKVDEALLLILLLGILRAGIPLTGGVRGRHRDGVDRQAISDGVVRF